MLTLWISIPDEASDFHGIVSSPHIHVLENGSLNIISVQTDDKGRYLCEAANGVGPSLSAAVDLVVHRKCRLIVFEGEPSVQFTLIGLFKALDKFIVDTRELDVDFVEQFVALAFDSRIPLPSIGFMNGKPQSGS